MGSIHTPVSIFHEYKGLEVPTDAVLKVAETIYAGEHISKSKETIIVFCSDYVIKRLNTTYRSINKATDVLSFPFDEPDLLGEIYISLQRARVQARRFGLSYTEEITRLVVHGLLHLHGYDHIEEKQRIKMEKRELLYRTDK